MAPRVRIHLFGPPSAIDSGGSAIANLGPGKPFALLAYLMVEGPTARDAVVALLWGDVPEAKARNAFRQALHRLRSALGEDVIPHDTETLRVSETAGLMTDLQTFDEALRSGDTERALAEYRGDFLAGLDVREPAFDQWLATNRARFRARYSDALRGSLQRLLEAGDTDRALARAATLVAAAPSDAEATLGYASILLASGRRAEALHAIKDFSDRFQENVGKAPPAAIREMETRLRRTPTENPSGTTRSVPIIVGRDRELSILLGAWRGVERGAGSVVFMEGALGSGKTRILEEFFTRAADIGSPLLLLGRERAAGSGVPYASIAEALRGTLDAAGLAGTSQHLLAEAARILPQLRDQFTLPATPEVSDDASRLRFFEGIAALLDSVAYEQPVCLALDDFQNSSESTLALAFYLADRLRAAPILFLFAGRSGAAFTRARGEFGNGNSTHADAGESGAIWLKVGPLSDAAAAQLARGSSSKTIDEETIARIVSLSEGLPFRIRELSARAVTGAPLGDSPIPLKTVLWARLQRCNQAEQRLFVAAALLDRPASIRLLAAASHLSEVNALDAALALEKEGLLVQRDDGVIPAHDMAAELALEGTGPAGRALLAGWAADALLREGGASDAELAALFVAAGRREEAFKHSRNAGYAAASAGAFDDATRHFEIAYSTAASERDRVESARMRDNLKGGGLRITGEVSNPPSPSPELKDEVKGVKPATPEPSRTQAPSPVGKATDGLRGWKVRPALLGMAVLSTMLLLAKGITTTRDATPGTSLRDTVLVEEETSPRKSVIAFATGPIGTPVTTLPGVTKNGAPSWLDSLRVPWINPRLSPDGKYAAVEKITPAGSDLYAVSIDRRDTVPIATGPGDDIAAGWSPDSRWILATRGETRSDGSYVADLYAYSLFDRGRVIALDTSGLRSVVDASWSPDGTHVAWTARVGATHQQDVFLSDADGSNIADITNSPAEDYSIAWSPDGGTLAFTSERTGFAELYSIELRGGILRRLTWDRAHADRAGYSPDGRWIAYESTRGGVASVYVMSSRGGTGRLVSKGERRVSLAGWRGPAVPYLDQMTVVVPDFQLAGGARTIAVLGFDQFGRSMPVGYARVRSLTPALASISRDESADSAAKTVRAQMRATADGLARIEANAGGWRADTAFVSIGTQSLTLLRDGFESQLSKTNWKDLGFPRPIVQRGEGESGSSGLLARSDRQWESGVLSAQVFPMRTGLQVESWVKAPFSGVTTAGTSLGISLVAADPAGVQDSTAPEFFRLASISWLGEAGRLSYSVDREIYTEPIGMVGASGTHHLMMRIEPDRSVGFYVDGARRWKSTLQVRVVGPNSRAQLWLSSQSTPTGVAFDNVAVSLGPAVATPAGENR